MRLLKRLSVFFMVIIVCINPLLAQRWVVATQQQPITPVLIDKDWNPVLKIVFKPGPKPEDRANPKTDRLYNLAFDFSGTTDLADLDMIALFEPSRDKGTLLAAKPMAGKKIFANKISLNLSTSLNKDSVVLWAAVRLRPKANLRHQVNVRVFKALTDKAPIKVVAPEFTGMRIAMSLHQKMQFGVHTARIPGLVTATDGTLLAMWDARKENGRDLQGDIDIVIRRSTDGGQSWSQPVTAIDMHQYGGLPEKFNGVSDANILVDKNTGKIFVFGLWMHGVINEKTGQNETDLDEFSGVWNHQWRNYGSQPGYDLNRSAQVMMVQSTDQGRSWSTPINITRQVKNENWWLLAPAPGRGITLKDGTLVFPSEGRDGQGKAFSSITYSKDGGTTWSTSNAAYNGTNESTVVQLSNGSLMLNMRKSSNRGLQVGNGRVVATTSDLGQHWTEHPTSRNALIEPACMASLLQENGVLYFLNPNSKTKRDKMTLKTSFDLGQSWPEKYWLELDQYSGSGYSCITNYDDEYIAVLYEGSGADMVFQLVRKPKKQDE